MESRQEARTDKDRQIEGKEAKPRRFRLVKLEERIAPGSGHTFLLCKTDFCVTHPPRQCK